jgi:HK97 family phage prohead protease
MAYKIEVNGLELKNADGINVIGSDFKVQIKELDTFKRTFWAVGSEESPDRDKDIIRVAGWNLKNYKKAPRGLWMHNYFEHPHFKTIDIKKKDNQLIFQPQFDTHDRATLTFNQYVNGFLDDFSVGFIPGKFEYLDEDNKWGGGRDFTKGHELLEISSVTVPAHPNAQMFRSNGLIPEDMISLMTLGYKSEFHYDLAKNHYWYPVLLNMDAYRIPKTIKLGNGISVVKALSRFDEEEKEVIVGYSFDYDVFKNENLVSKWIEDQLTNKPVSKYYKIEFNKEKSELDISIVTEEKDIPIVFFEFEGDEEEKGNLPDDEPNDDQEKDCDCETFEASEEDSGKCKGCGGKKPKKADDADEDDSDEDDNDKNIDTANLESMDNDPNIEKDIAEKIVEILFQKFDKFYEDRVKSIVTEFEIVKASFGEIKELLLKLVEFNEGLENKSDDQLIDLSELSEKDLVLPVSNSLEDDSNKIEIDPDSFKQMSKDAVLEQLSSIFESILITEKNNFSGGLDN